MSPLTTSSGRVIGGDQRARIGVDPEVAAAEQEVVNAEREYEDAAADGAPGRISAARKRLDSARGTEPMSPLTTSSGRVIGGDQRARIGVDPEVAAAEQEVVNAEREYEDAAADGARGRISAARKRLDSARAAVECLKAGFRSRPTRGSTSTRTTDATRRTAGRAGDVRQPPILMSSGRFSRGYRAPVSGVNGWREQIPTFPVGMGCLGL